MSTPEAPDWTKLLQHLPDAQRQAPKAVSDAIYFEALNAINIRTSGQERSKKASQTWFSSLLGRWAGWMAGADWRMPALGGFATVAVAGLGVLLWRAGLEGPSPVAADSPQLAQRVEQTVPAPAPVAVPSPQPLSDSPAIAAAPEFKPRAEGLAQAKSTVRAAPGSPSPSLAAARPGSNQAGAPPASDAPVAAAVGAATALPAAVAAMPVQSSSRFNTTVFVIAPNAVAAASAPLPAAFFAQNTSTVPEFVASDATKTEAAVAAAALPAATLPTPTPAAAPRMQGLRASPMPLPSAVSPAPAAAPPSPPLGVRWQTLGGETQPTPEAARSAIEQELLAWRGIADAQAQAQAQAQRTAPGADLSSSLAPETQLLLRWPAEGLTIRLPAPDAKNQDVFINGQRVAISPERVARLRALLAER